MSLVHPSHYLFAGSRQTRHSNEKQDEIQVIYVGNAQNAKPYKLIKCTQPAALNAMDPRQLILHKQLEQLKKLQTEYGSLNVVHNSPTPPMNMSDGIKLEIIQYSDD